MDHSLKVVTMRSRFSVPKQRLAPALAAIWIVFFTVSAPTVSRAGPLTAAHRQGYVQWLHSLEQTFGARQQDIWDEREPLYPFAQPPAIRSDEPSYRYLAISRALGKMEQAHLGTPPPPEMTAFHALGMARSYRHLCEYDSSLAWFGRADRTDTTEAYADVIGQESLATAIALADSLHIVKRLINTLGTSQIQVRQAEMVLAYRYLLVHGDTLNLSLLVKKVSRLDGQMNDRLRYWHAFALTSLKEWGRALPHLLHLIERGSHSCGLTLRQRAWILMKIPDLLLLLDEQAAAGDLYHLLAASEIRSIRTWSEFQLANLDFLARRYRKAWAVYTGFCEGREDLWWSQQACMMARLADQLQPMQQEGEVYGAAVKP